RPFFGSLYSRSFISFHNQPVKASGEREKSADIQSHGEEHFSFVISIRITAMESQSCEECGYDYQDNSMSWLFLSWSHFSFRVCLIGLLCLDVRVRFCCSRD